MKRMERTMTRMAFLDEAAFEIVLRVGVAALTRRSIAAELGISDGSVRNLVDPTVDLATLAAARCAHRRRHVWQRRDHQRPPARQLVEALVPADEDLDVEVVWLRLSCHAMSMAGSDDLLARFQVADRGHSDAVEPPRAGPTDDVEPMIGTERAGLATFLADHGELLRDQVTQLLGHTAGTSEIDSVLALSTGLTTMRCSGTLDRPTALALLEAAVVATGVALDAPRPGPRRAGER